MNAPANSPSPRSETTTEDAKYVVIAVEELISN